jgi:hypothetical protein
MENIISKDLVVLSKEEYAKDFCSQFNKGYERGSKETAREILAWLKAHCDYIGFSVIEAYFKEAFGVDIKE